MASGKCVEELLIENGIPYDVKFAERPETLTDLTKYKLLILPFAYSLSKESFNEIQSAVDSGVKLLIIDQLAPTDEYGNMYPEPLLKSLLGKNNVVYENINLSRKGMLKSIRQKILSDIKKLTGETGIRFEQPNGRVEFLIRKVENGSLILYLANWAYEPATPILGLDLPQGKYEITFCGGDDFVLKEGLLNGQKQPDASAFKNFSLSLAPSEVMLIYINPAKISQ
jgi:beta-galactosidase GanA